MSQMTKYHILINDIQKGPFSIEELKKIELNKSTLVWHKELEDWTELQNIKELNILLESTPPPIPKKNDKKESIKKETANQIVNAYKLIKTSFGLGFLYFIGYAIYNKLINFGLLGTKFSSTDAERIFGYMPRQYVFKETSRSGGQFGSSFGFMEISKSGEEEVKSLIINELTEQTFIFTLIMVVSTFIVLLVYFYLKRGVKWTKKYSD
jgi:hypothetical protein